VSWRQQVQLYRSCRLFLCQVSPPQLVVDVLEDLHREGRLLSRRQASALEDHILRWVNADGAWR